MPHEVVCFKMLNYEKTFQTVDLESIFVENTSFSTQSHSHEAVSQNDPYDQPLYDTRYQVMSYAANYFQ